MTRHEQSGQRVSRPVVTEEITEWEAEVGALKDRLAVCEAALDAVRRIVDEYAEAAQQLQATGQLPRDLLRRREEQARG
jgi:gamma-glutamyl:cysteine ligase YbdK (ATP-grasp superfamily)